ncbi:Phosphoglucosamine mutase [Labeo rohita]|uniref:Phosphoglucosamine mutase n=1 Tax=Labeo rohita TaxID=84645 RepID=A0ABQ8N0H2_LABRO|nr:Phosphoglucosamine mutase [Labeo rohita]
MKDKRVHDWLEPRKLEVSLSSVHSLNQSGCGLYPHTSISFSPQPISGRPQPSHIVSSSLSQWCYVKFYYIKATVLPAQVEEQLLTGESTTRSCRNTDPCIKILFGMLF